VSNITSADTRLACSFTYWLKTTTADLDHCVAEHLWYICLLGRATAGLSYERYIAIRYTFKLPTYIQETVGDR